MSGKFKYNKKITIVLASCILLPCVIIFCIFFGSYISKVYTRIENETQKTIDEVNYNAAELSTKIHQKARFLTLYAELNEVLQSDENTNIDLVDMLDKNRMINDVIDALVSENNIIDVVVYTTNENARLGVIKQIENDEFFENISEMSLGEWRVESNNNSERLLNLYKKYRVSTDNYNVIRISVPFESAIRAFENLEYENSYISLTAPGMEELVFTYNSGKYSESQLPDDGFYIVDGAVAPFGIDVKIYIDNAVIYQEIAMLVLICLFVLGIMILVIFLIAKLISDTLFIGIADMVESISTNNMDKIKKSAYKNREIEIIKNYLLDLQRKLKTENEERLKFELELLAERISPHFLYNNLSAIKSNYENTAARKAIDALVKYYRNVFQKGDRMTTVKAEVENGVEYLKLMRFSYDNKFEINVNVDEECNNRKIPANILQPVLENAFIHGINGRDIRGYIAIEARSEGDDVIIIITDNGGRFNKERFEQRMRDSGKNHALKTVMTRMRLYYDDERYTMNISGDTTKTVVTFRFRKEA